MPKSIIEIDVESSSFNEFSELFEKYQAKVQKLPGAWGNVNKEIKSGFETATAALLAQGELNRRALTASSEAANSARSVSGYWKEAATNVGTFSNKVLGSVKSLIEMTGIVGAVGGLVGMGGLWGLDRLAGSVGNARMANQGLNIDQGTRVAFGLNMGRIVGNPSALLSDVNAALHDPSQLSRLYAAGVTNTQGRDTGQVSLELLDKYKQLADQTSPQMLGAVLQAHGGLISLEDFVRLKSLSTKEYSDIKKQTAADAITATQTDKVMRDFQELDNRLRGASNNIEAAFIRGLDPLIPSLTGLSVHVTDALTRFMASIKPADIDKLGKYIDEFGNYLSSKQFRTDIKNFGEDLHTLAGAVASALKLLGFKPAAGALIGAYAGAKIAGPAGAVAGALLGGTAGELKEYTGAHPESLPDNPYKDQWFPTVDMSGVKNFLRLGGGAGPSAQIDITPPGEKPSSGFDLMGLIRKLEGSGDNAISKAFGAGHGGAIGRYQIMPGTAKELGFDPAQLTDPAYALQVAKAAVQDIIKQGAKTLDEILVGYNSSPKFLKKFIASHDDPSVLMPETQKYLQHAHKLMASAGAVSINIYNNTGGNAIVSAGQLAR